MFLRNCGICLFASVIASLQGTVLEVSDPPNLCNSSRACGYSIENRWHSAEGLHAIAEASSRAAVPHCSSSSGSSRCSDNRGRHKFSFMCGISTST
eukprot:19137-Heterococcus_DN1.PRE.2